MTIKEIIENTKERETDLTGIKVVIKDKDQLTFLDNPKEVYYGELLEIPTEYLNYEILEISQICDSSEISRIGTNVLVVRLNESADITEQKECIKNKHGRR